MVYLAWYLTGYLITEFLLDVFLAKNDNVILALAWPLLWVVAIAFIVFVVIPVVMYTSIVPERKHENNSFYSREVN